MFYIRVGNSLFHLFTLCSFAQNHSFQRATMSNSLMSLLKKERECDSLKKGENRTFNLSLTKNERFIENR